MSVLTDGSLRLLKNKYCPSFEMKGSIASPVYPVTVTGVGFEKAVYAVGGAESPGPDDPPQLVSTVHRSTAPANVANVELFGRILMRLLVTLRPRVTDCYAE